MILDIPKALMSPFSDDEWKSKIFILTLLSILGTFLELSGLGWLSWLPIFIFIGYCTQVVHNEIHNIVPLLPDWHSNFVKYLKYGAIFSFITFIYSIIIFLLMVSMIKLSYTLILGIGVFIFSAVCLWITGAYCDNFKFKDSFAINNCLKLFSRAKWELAVTLLIILILFAVCFNFIVILTKLKLSQNIIRIILSPLSPFVSLFINNLIAQTYKAGRYL